jgi:hypothetical protein
MGGDVLVFRRCRYGDRYQVWFVVVNNIYPELRGVARLCLGNGEISRGAEEGAGRN